jgi:hypothetical protein
MITIKLDGKIVQVEDDSTLLQAAQNLGIDIPTMCYLEECGPITSCMVCVVEDIVNKKLIPACSAPVSEGMVIETINPRIEKARKDTLDLLLSEHVGNCEGPCQRSCPAYMNIPLMIRQIKEEQIAEALITVKQNIALPAVLGRICPAPCEKGCNRKYHDGTLSICLLKRFVADADLEGNTPYIPEKTKYSGKRVAIFGAGPAGLAAAYYLLPQGHHCSVFDAQDEPGGLLRYGIPDDRYDKRVLDSEIDIIRKLGADFQMRKKLGENISLREAQNEYDAVVLATGSADQQVSGLEGLNQTARGLIVDKKTFQTSLPSVFAGGNILTEGRMAIRSLAHGKFIAESINQMFSGQPVKGYQRRFNSVIGRLTEEESAEFAGQVGPYKTISPVMSKTNGFSTQEAVKESGRCFRCDCRKQVSCKLRQYADAYNGNQQRFKTGLRKRVRFDVQHDLIIYEQGKCIKCGLCVKITEQAKEDLGLTFIGRGFDVRISVPLNQSMHEGLKKVALEVVDACPTAALALKNKFEKSENEL